MITASAGTVSVNITANMADFNRNMEKARKESTAFDAQAKKASTQATANLRALGASASGAAAAIAPLQSQFSRLRTLQVQYTGELTRTNQATAASFTGVAQGARKVSEEVGRTTKQMGALTTATKGASAALMFMRQQFGFLGALTVGYTIFQMVDAFAQFESKMNNVRAVSGATASQFSFLNEKAQELGATTRYTASQVAEGMSFMAMAGLSVGNIYGGIRPVLTLASAGNMELGQSADIVTNIMTGMGLQVTDLTRAVDVMAKTFTSSNTDLINLGYAFKYAAPAAATAGLEFEEVAAAMGLMGNAGVQGSMAGTAMRGAILRLLAPTNEAKKVMKELGLSVMDASGNMRPLVDIIRQLEPLAKSGAKGVEALNAIFGARPFQGIAAVLRQGGDELERFTQMLRDSGGTAEKIAEIQMEGLKGAFIELTSAAEGLAVAIGESGLGKALESLADSFTSVFRSMTEGIKSMRPVTEQSFTDLRSNLVDMNDQLRVLDESIARANTGGFLSKRGLPELEARRKALVGNIDTAEELLRLQARLAGTVLRAPPKKPIGDVGDPPEVDLSGEMAESKRRAALTQLQQLESEYLESTKQNRRLIEVEHERELVKFKDLLDKKLISEKEYETAREQLAVVTNKKLEELREKDLKFIQDIGNSLSSNLEGAFRNFIQTGKLDFQELTRSILADIAVISLRMAVLQPLFGGGPGGGTGAFGNILGSLFHTGGTVGMGSGVQRSMPASLFIGAPRLHKGGQILGADEVPAILQRGERVIPRGMNDNRPAVTVQIVNNTGAQVREESTRNSDGEEIRRFIIEESNRGIARGAMDGSMRSRFGSQVAGTRR